MHRDPDLLYAIRFLPCQIQIPGVCLGASAPTVACHSNESADGKGKSIKAHDHRAAAGCAACHHEVDFSSRLSGDERTRLLDLGMSRTALLLFLRGMVVVAPEWRRPAPEEGDLRLQQEALSRQPLVRKRPAQRKRPTKTGHQNGRSTETPSKIFKGFPR